MLLHALRDAAFRRLMKLSDRALGRLAGPPVRLDGQTLDVQIQTLLRAAKLAGVKDPAGVAESREAMDRDIAAVAPPPVAMARERDFSIDAGGVNLPARLYVPKSAPKVPPVLVYFHGGGFVCGSLASHDASLRELAAEAGLAVLSVAYRLAPEHKVPAGTEDGIAAYRWVRAHAKSLGVDGDKIGVGGDSAGGNLSAILCHACKRSGDPQPTVQLLIYPATDLTCTAESHALFGKGFLLESARIDWYLGHYLNRDEERRAAYVSPLFEPDFHGLAPAIVVTAGFDPLRDEGSAYAKKLQDARVPTTYRCESGLIHGFFAMSGVVREARAANLRMAEDLRRAFARS